MSSVALLIRTSSQVLFHLSIKKETGGVLESSRLDEDGAGVPKAFVLEKGRRAPRGWELALQGAASTLLEIRDCLSLHSVFPLLVL